MQWQQPNDLRVDVIGRRFETRNRTLQLSSVWDRPWFVPRGVDDSVRIFSNDFPATGALHPLASSGPAWYRYTMTGDLTVTPARGGALRLLRVEVTPRRTGPALVAGQMWIDSATAEVVRFTFRYLGTALWVRAEEGPRGPDSAKARRLNALGNRVVSIDADLEYGLQEGRYWMPYRQVIAGRVRLPVVSDVVIPFQATTTFDDYTINGGHPIAFAVALPDTAGLTPDSLRALRRARQDSLRAERRGRAGETADSLRSWDYADRWPGGRYELHRPVERHARPLRRVARLALARDRSGRRAPPPRGGGGPGAAERGAARFGHGAGGARLRVRAAVGPVALRSGAGSLVRSRAIACARPGCGSPISTARCATA